MPWEINQSPQPDRLPLRRELPVNYPPQPGDILSLDGHKCEIKEELGRGGLGITYIAHRYDPVSPTLREAVVIKVPHIDTSRFPLEQWREWLARANDTLQDEMSVLTALGNKPGIAGIVDAGAVKFVVDGLVVLSFFLVYQYVDGEPLAKWCERMHASPRGGFRGVNSANVWFQVAKQLAEAIAGLHDERVIHGDLWPDNILVEYTTGRVVLIDFGQAWLLDRLFERAADAERDHEYLAPERLKTGSGRTKLARIPSRWHAPADIYSYGGTLFYLATGKKPPDTTRPGGQFIRHQDLKDLIIAEISAANPGLLAENAGIADIITMCMRPDQADRPQHMGQVRENLDAFWSMSHRNPRLNTEIGVASASLQEAVGQIEMCAVSSNMVFKTLILQQINRLQDRLRPVSTRLLAVDGSREDMIQALLTALSVLNAGDSVAGLTSQLFWQTENFGPGGRVMTALSMAASRGVKIKWNILVQSGRVIRQTVDHILHAQRDYALKLRAQSVPRDSYDMLYTMVTPEELKRFRKGRESFVLLKAAESSVLFAPDYNVQEGRISLLRCWANPQSETRFLQAFERYRPRAKSVEEYTVRTDFSI